MIVWTVVVSRELVSQLAMNSPRFVKQAGAFHPVVRDAVQARFVTQIASAVFDDVRGKKRVHPVISGVPVHASAAKKLPLAQPAVPQALCVAVGVVNRFPVLVLTVVQKVSIATHRRVFRARQNRAKPPMPVRPLEFATVTTR